ncbi:MAG: sel1 repeat family protein [Alphaproteobacteria bacterium]|nr:sel1 repeat family protein [Alphaproteobacteria bacterium]
MRIFEAIRPGLMFVLPALFVAGGSCITKVYALDRSSGHSTVSIQKQTNDVDDDVDGSSVKTAKSSTSPILASPVQRYDEEQSSSSEMVEGPPSTADLTKAPLEALSSVVDATRNAIRSYLAGNKDEAVKSLEYAADQGHAPAQWKLARMYAEGDGVPRDDLRAFEAFSKVCDRHADEAPDSPTAPFVANAFVALGSYYLNGIPNSAVKANPSRAREMFNYSASYFGDAQAQLILARLYLEGIGGSKDMKQAVRWLNLSAEKGNRIAQAQLGQLLFSGEAGMKQRARGLMWLSVARVGADPQKDAWIIDAHEEAMEKASEADRYAAIAYGSQREKRSK